MKIQSIGKVAVFEQSYSAAGGGIIAAIAVGIGALFNTKTKELESTTPTRKLLGTVQSADNSGLDESACLTVKNIGKPCAGKLPARFDEGGLGRAIGEGWPRLAKVTGTHNLIPYV